MVPNDNHNRLYMVITNSGLESPEVYVTIITLLIVFYENN